MSSEIALKQLKWEKLQLNNRTHCLYSSEYEENNCCKNRYHGPWSTEIILFQECLPFVPRSLALRIQILNEASKDEIFRVVSGLDGKDGTVSLESGSQAGCYIYKPGQSMKLRCESGSSDTGFNQGASFVMNKGLSEYHPISFVAKGDKRNFLLAPLHSFRDEFYTIYFNIQA